MSDDGRQGKRLFGMRRPDVPDGEVETRVRVAEERAQTAEARIGDLQAELSFYGDAIRALRGELETMTERVVSRVAPQVVELEARNAETEAVREAVEGMRGEVKAERDRLAAWRGELQSTVSSLQVDIDAARRAIDEIPERIRDVLTPAARAMQSVTSGMQTLAGMSVPSSAMSGDQDEYGFESDATNQSEAAEDEAPRSGFDYAFGEADMRYRIFGSEHATQPGYEPGPAFDSAG